LAENPGILKPTLNNTGPFRRYLHQAILDNRPVDRFATDLVMMEGSVNAGGPASFGIASENDAPMVAKAHTLARAFLAVDLTCARCHDAPAVPYKQRQLFAMAAMLARAPLKVPATSTVPVVEGGRKAAVRVTLKAGEAVAPEWLLKRLAEGVAGKGGSGTDDPSAGLVRNPSDSRERLAVILTSPRNERFPRVIVNRVWKRLMGLGLIEPVDDWRDDDSPSHPELMDFLARELVTGGYDLRHLTGLILRSAAYQRAVVANPAADPRLFASAVRRRLSAEQIVDSLFAAAGKGFDCEELTFDPEGRRDPSHSPNLGRPTRAWQLVGLGGERDRPALALPRAAPIVDVLMSFGWRDTRTVSQTVRDETVTPLTPMSLAGGNLLNARIIRLSEDSAVTEIALRDGSAAELVERTFLRVLSRPPTPAERAAALAVVAEGFDARRTGRPAAEPARPKVSMVSWSNRLHPAATLAKMEVEKAVRAGDPPTVRLTDDWRRRYEDLLWGLFNSPEFVFLP
jgi:hypothetical protein